MTGHTTSTLQHFHFSLDATNKKIFQIHNQHRIHNTVHQSHIACEMSQ